MGKLEAQEYIRNRISEPIKNLKSWKYCDWILYWILIPLILILIYLIPFPDKNLFFILNTSNWLLPSLYSNAFTHSSIDHLSGNQIFYIVWIAFLFAFEGSKKVFHWATLVFFLVIPIISSIATIFFYGYIEKTGSVQGFSGIVAALSAYALIAFLRWGFVDIINSFSDWKNLKMLQKIAFLVIDILFAAAILIIIQEGLNLGQFVSGEGFVSNGLVHFIGFLFGLIVPLILYWKFIGKELIFDSVVIFSIFLVFLKYYQYLQQVFNIVRTN